MTYGEWFDAVLVLNHNVQSPLNSWALKSLAAVFAENLGDFRGWWFFMGFFVQYEIE